MKVKVVEMVKVGTTREEECEGFYLATSPEVISNLWRCLGSLVIKMIQKYLRKITKKTKSRK